MGSRISALAERDPVFRIVPTIEEADVMIDFSHPDATVPNLQTVKAAKKAAVVGTTGHSPKQREEIEKMGRQIPLVFSPNTSVGVNLFWKLLEQSAHLLGAEFQVKVREAHHIHKKDAPSGTALQIAKILAAVRQTTPDKIPIESIREGEVVGDHTVIFETAGDILELTHRAKSRDTFALGALRAAQWITGKPNGLYSMADVLGLKRLV